MANEKRLIDANVLLEKVAEMNDSKMNGVTIAVAIAKCPTVDAVEVVHGRWRLETDEEQPIFIYKLFVCSACDDRSTLKFNYCPNCGAKMDKNENP